MGSVRKASAWLGLVDDNDVGVEGPGLAAEELGGATSLLTVPSALRTKQSMQCRGLVTGELFEPLGGASGRRR